MNGTAGILGSWGRVVIGVRAEVERVDTEAVSV